MKYRYVGLLKGFSNTKGHELREFLKDVKGIKTVLKNRKFQARRELERGFRAGKGINRVFQGRKGIKTVFKDRDFQSCRDI